jgi:hypothetical protein
MAFGDISSAQAIRDAVAECDKLGRSEFLRRYGYGRAKNYFLVVNNHEYDSKAIVGVAHKFQFPDQGPLMPGDFSGGEDTVKQLLESLDFDVRVKRDISAAN